MEVKLKAEPRGDRGKGVARKLRAEGKVPAVLYGPQLDTLSVAVDSRELWHALHTDAGLNVLIDLQLDGEEYLTMPREVQRDIVRGTLLHVDFLQIRKDVAIQVEVPVTLVGESAGVKSGGVVEHHLWQLRVECLPMQVPEQLEADISGLEIGDSLHVRDISAPEGVRILNDEEEPVVAVVPPPVLEVETPAEEGAEAEEGAVPAEGEEPTEAPAEGATEGSES